LQNQIPKTILYTLFALIAFAGNSVLCRLALAPTEQNIILIDANSFTLVRLLSGIVTLALILVLTQNKDTITSKGSWTGGLALFVYAAGFSYAYITLETGTGALVLFGAVQLTLISISLFKGNRLATIEWLGLIIAFVGFVYLVLPNIASPSITGFVVMTLAGVAWGVYTYKGIGVKNPLAETSFNFFRTLPLIALLTLVSLPTLEASQQGVLLGIASGALTSAVGYTIWYMALRHLHPTLASVSQLSVPVIAAFGGLMFVNEPLTLRLVISTSLILGGIALIVLYRYRVSVN
jgi:drug/metabolite transporter (DMT)-like permease